MLYKINQKKKKPESSLEAKYLKNDKKQRGGGELDSYLKQKKYISGYRSPHYLLHESRFPLPYDTKLEYRPAPYYTAVVNGDVDGLDFSLAKSFLILLLESLKQLAGGGGEIGKFLKQKTKKTKKKKPRWLTAHKGTKTEEISIWNIGVRYYWKIYETKYKNNHKKKKNSDG